MSFLAARLLGLGNVYGFLLLIGSSACTPGESAEDREVHPRRGDLSTLGGSPTVRRPYVPEQDNPSTTNDESNDQPLGHFGTMTMTVSSLESGNTYTLDVEIDGREVHRIYFPKGGWVDFLGCELEMDLSGECVDESGRTWVFEGTDLLAPGLLGEDFDLPGEEDTEDVNLDAEDY